MLKVANLNIFWNNGSYETPISHPPLNKFTDKENANLALTTIDIGTVVLEGKWNYAHYKDSYYFLEKIKTLDIDKDIHKYSVIRDLSYELCKLDDLVVYGELNKVTDKEIIKENINLVQPLLSNPADLELIDLPYSKADSNFKVIEKTEKIIIPEKLQLITTDSWNTFVDQYNRIPDNSTRKKRQAVLACLSAEEIKHWKYIVYNDYLKPLIEEIKRDLGNYKIVQIDNTTTNLKGKYQLTKESGLLGTKLLNIKQLKKIDLSELTDITPVNPGDLEKIFVNREIIDTFKNVPKKKLNTTGYYEGVLFKSSATPWVDTDVNKDEQIPYDTSYYGIVEDLSFKQLNRSSDAFFNLNVNVDIPASKLASIKTKLDALDKDLKAVDYDQDNFLTWLNDNYVLKKFDEANVYYIPAGYYYPLRGQYVYKLSKWRYLSEGLPRRSDGSYDLERLNHLLTGRLDFFYSGTIFDWHYWVILGEKVIALRDEPKQKNIVDKIKELRRLTPLPNPNNNKKEILKAIYNHLKYPILDDEYFITTEEDLKKSAWIFDLKGTNYFLLLIDGKTSLAFKEIKNDVHDPLIENFSYKDSIEVPLSQSINSQRYLSIYGKEYLLNDKTNNIEDLEISHLAPTNKLNNYENLVIKYKTPFTCILDVTPISKESAVEQLSNFNAIEYEDSLINRRRQLRDHEITKEQLEIQRDKQNFELKQAWEQMRQDYTNSIISTALGAVTSVVKLGVGVATGGAAQGFLFGSSLDVGSNIANSVFNFQNLNRKWEALEFEEKNIMKNRLLENYKLEVDKNYLEYDNRKLIDRQVKLTTVTEVNDRDILNQLKILWNVGDVFLKVLKPTREQLHLLNEHTDHYGFDCSIPKFNLVWKDYLDKTNVWGFKYIKNINIKDPVLRVFIMGKLLNGLKLIKPTF